MEKRRIKLGPLNTAGAVASENRWVYRQLKAGNMDPTLAMKMSQILMNQRGMVESTVTENRLAQLEERLVDLATKGNTNVVQFKKAGGFDI
jgi:hypothetical protein